MNNQCFTKSFRHNYLHNKEGQSIEIAILVRNTFCSAWLRDGGGKAIEILLKLI